MQLLGSLFILLFFVYFKLASLWFYKNKISRNVPQLTTLINCIFLFLFLGFIPRLFFFVSALKLFLCYGSLCKHLLQLSLFISFGF